MNKNNNSLLSNKKLLIILIISIPIGYSLFSDVKTEEKYIEIGKVEVVLKEDPEWEENEDEFGIKKYTKSIKGVSVSEQDAYVRVRCIPVVEYYEEGINGEEGTWVTAPVSQDDILLVINTEDWVQDGDYWYYNKILKGLEETASLNIDWTILEIPSAISSKQIRTNVKVILEYSQVSNNMWKEIFQIEDLPEQVERVKE